MERIWTGRWGYFQEEYVIGGIHGMGQSRPATAGLTVWQLVMLALGTVVGGSFFLGSAIVLQATGPSILIALALGGALVFLILRALAELTVGRPARGSFREYAEQAFGPAAGFVVGWVYWTGMMLAMSSEATAVAVFLQLWVAAPLWLLSGLVIVAVTTVNLLTPHLFGRLETLMSGFKLGAVVLFILAGAALVVGAVPGRAPVGAGALAGQHLAPGGLGGIAGSMLLVMFMYAGFEVMGLAAADARQPQRTVPRAVTYTALALVVLYMAGFALLLPLLPRDRISQDVAPMVAALRYQGWPAAASALNLVVMSAALSTMLAALYGLGRMLYSLAEEGQAPRALARLSADGVPRTALAVSGLGMLVGSVLAFVLPRQVYLFLASSGGFSLLFSYLAILLSQLRVRSREGCPPAGCQMPGYPYSTWTAIGLMVVIMASMPLVAGQAAGLLAGLALVGAFGLVHWVTRRRRAPTGETPGERIREERDAEDGPLPLA